MSTSQPRPTELTIVALFALSGNVCAHPGCANRLFDASHQQVGRSCRIETSDPQGPRHNPALTDEQAAAFENFVLFCPAHRRLSDDERRYSVAFLRSIKHDHERQFADDPDAHDDAPRSLRALATTLEWSNWDEQMDEDTLKLYRPVVEALRATPHESRDVLLATLQYGTVEPDETVQLPAYELSERLNGDETRGRAHLQTLERHNLMQLVEAGDAVGPIALVHAKDGFWVTIMKFCERRGLPLDTFVMHERFELLE